MELNSPLFSLFWSSSSDGNSNLSLDEENQIVDIIDEIEEITRNEICITDYILFPSIY
jgi:hypothetical protein